MKYTIKTDVGVVRSENQDRAKVFENDTVTFAILCDGMGGHEGGSHAARITINQFGKEFSKSLPKTEDKYGEWFTHALKKSKKAMEKYAWRNSALLDMGTTVTAALITKSNIYVYNVGDSRTYVYNGLLHQITVDHNLRNHYIKKFGYSEEEAATVLGAAALTSALGPKKKTHVEQFIVENEPTVKYLILTSDGIHDYISKPNFETIISSDSTDEQKSEVLIKQAIKGKSSDNLTAIILEVN